MPILYYVITRSTGLRWSIRIHREVIQNNEAYFFYFSPISNEARTSALRRCINEQRRMISENISFNQSTVLFASVDHIKIRESIYSKGSNALLLVPKELENDGYQSIN